MQNEKITEALEVLEERGIYEASKILDDLKGFDKEKRLLACDLAVTVLKYVAMDEVRPRKAIEAARFFARGLIESDELGNALENARKGAQEALNVREAAREALKKAHEGLRHSPDFVIQSCIECTLPEVSISETLSYIHDANYEEICDILNDKTPCLNEEEYNSQCDSYLEDAENNLAEIIKCWAGNYFQN